MKKIILYIVTIPILILGIVLTILSIPVFILMSPIFLLLALIDWLKGDKFFFFEFAIDFCTVGIQMYYDSIGKDWKYT